uniref:Marek's disease gammaherpesvirus tumorigenicity associated n=1 Tax=Infectious laryngotracheitis virus TaxID=10386 RepID=Q69314_ILTV|nr:orf7 protein - Marek's disease virus (strain RBIB) [Gallid alphaherpesvirus 2]AAA72289.1 unnamed protein product [Gallid alphaherpesvirus 1]
MEGYMSFSAEIGSGGRGMFHETVDLSHHRQLLPRGFAHVCRDSCNLYIPKFILGLSLHPILVGVST